MNALKLDLILHISLQIEILEKELADANERIALIDADVRPHEH